MNNVLLAWVSRYFKKEKIMIFVKNKLVYIRRQKMHIFGATPSLKTLEGSIVNWVSC